MKQAVRLLGPTAMIFIGLQWFESVAVTFLLFYFWLLAMPLIDRSFPVKSFRFTFKTTVSGILSGLLFFGVIFGGLSWLHIYLFDVEQLRVLLLDWGFSGPGEVWLILVLLLANPVLEEIYWRGYMHEKLRMGHSAMFTIWMTAVFYTLYHLLSIIPIFKTGFSFAAVLPVLIAGLFWAYVREKTGSIAATIIGHILGDLGIICVYWFIVR